MSMQAKGKQETILGDPRGLQVGGARCGKIQTGSFGGSNFGAFWALLRKLSSTSAIQKLVVLI